MDTVKTVSITVQPKQWKQFIVASAAKGLGASANVRLLVSEFLRREAREARADRA